jgi:hypothetical protein
MLNPLNFLKNNDLLILTILLLQILVRQYNNRSSLNDDKHRLVIFL